MLECTASAICKTFQWQFNENDICEGDKYQIRRDGDSYLLRICDLTLNDAGIYTCIVQDDHQRQISTSAEVKVSGQYSFTCLYMSFDFDHLQQLVIDQSLRI